MDLRVNHNEINEFCDMTNMESEMMKDVINLWLEKFDELREIWQGDDADKFFDNATSYVKRLNVIPQCYDSLSGFVGSANKEYRDTDIEGKKDFEKDTVYEEGVMNVQGSNNRY